MTREGGQNPDHFFPLLSFPVAMMSPGYVPDLDRGVNYVFFVEPEANDTINAIYDAFPQAATHPTPFPRTGGM